MVMTPPQLHIKVEVFVSAGLLPIITVGEPGAQGAVVTGIQGMSVNTPNAAEVADATIGLASEVHIPNGGMFAIGKLSMIVAAGRLLAVTMLDGRTIRLAGATPN